MALKEVSLRADGTVTEDGETDAVYLKNVTKVSLYINATLAGTSPSYKAVVQTKDANGNWFDLSSGKTITSTGSEKELGLTGPFGSAFRVREDVDVADADETYTDVDVALHFEYDE